jgi:hypothetical protein
MLAKTWIAVLMGLLLGSLLFSSGCGWIGNGYSNNPYGTPCSCGATHPAIVPPNAAPTSGGTPGWRSVPAASSEEPAREGTAPDGGS